MPPASLSDFVRDNAYVSTGFATGGNPNGIFWSGLILPQVEQQSLYSQIEGMGFGIIWTGGGANQKALESKLPVFRCPSALEYSLTYNSGGITARVPGNYGVVTSGSLGYVTAYAAYTNQHMDDAGRVDQLNYFYIGTPTIVDRPAEFCGSTGIELNSLDRGERGFVGFRSQHPGGVQFAVLDGATRFFSENTDRAVMAALGTRASGESVQMP